MRQPLMPAFPSRGRTREKPTLTRRMNQVASLLVVGKRNREIASCMGVTLGYVRVLVSQMYARAGVSNRIRFMLWYQDQFSEREIARFPIGAEGLNKPL